MVKGQPLRLCSKSHSCATLYAGQSFMKGQYVKQEPENIEDDLRATLLQRSAATQRLAELRDKARKIESELPVLPRKEALASPVVPATRPVATPARGVSTDAQPRSQQLWEAAFPNRAEPDGDESGVPGFMEADRAGGGPAGSAQVSEEPPRTEVLSGDVEPRPTHEPEPTDSDDELIMDVDCDMRSNTIRITAREYRNYVSDDVAERWKNTKSRKQLIVALINCNGDKDSFNQKMEIVIRNIKEGKVVIDSGYYTESAMKTELKFDKDRVKAVIAYCTASRARRRALTRRDKYQRHLIEYWIDVRTSGSLSRTTQEQFSQYVEIIDDQVSLPPPMLGTEALPCYDEDEPEDEETGDDDDADREGKTATTTPASKRKRRGKTPSPKAKLLSRQKREKAEAVETALEDIEKIPQVLGEILKVRIKIDNTLDLMKGDETKTKIFSCSIRDGEEIMALHDHLAEIKCENGKGDPKPETSRITMEEKKLKRTVLRPKGKAKAKGKSKKREPHDDDVLEKLINDRLVVHPRPWRKLVVSDRLLCSIAAGFVDECHDLKDFITGLASCGKLPLLWGSKNATDRTDVLSKFWRRWRVHDRSHEVYEHHGKHLDLVFPIQVHADEGQSVKKSGVMVLNWQSPIGFGVSTQDDCAAAMSVNFVGSSFATRFIYTICLKRCYSKKKRYVLDGIFENLASELVDLFYNGVSVRLGIRS
ncbi:unnamed protein product [Symbiodinium sp. CCMP2592]|nr:unnamed protein product [Symbiodinium sp. CCMP2592]